MKDRNREWENLNEQQKEAVLDDSAACIVNANVGSGKTTVLTAKIHYLHSKCQVDYADMVVLTFTNKAANEIRERLSVRAQEVESRDMRYFGTFHSVALSLLRNLLSVEQLGYTEDFQVIDPEEEVELALQVIREQKLNIKYKNRLKKRLEQEKVSRCQDDLALLRELLQKEKIRQNKMSFADLLQTAAILLKDISLRIKWIIIDEAQDCDRQQMDFVNALKQKDTRLFAVGDPNQVVYSWRSGAWNVFYLLKEQYQARELSLPVNYRSSSSILEAAKRFLQNGSQLTGVRETGQKIWLREQYDSFQDACCLADRIRELHENGLPYSEMAVFYRLQSQSAVFEQVFERNEIPFEVSLKKTIQDIPVLNWLMKLLRFSANHRDLTSGQLVLSHRNYGAGLTENAAGKLLREWEAADKKLEQGGGLAGEDGRKARKPEQGGGPAGEDGRKARKPEQGGSPAGEDGRNGRTQTELLQKMWNFQGYFAELEPQNLKEEELWNYFQLDRHLHPTSSAYPEDKKLVMELFGLLLEDARTKQVPLWEALTDFLNSASLYGINFLKTDSANQSDTVKLMTLHASKGLEFSHVFITGVNNGLIPLQGKGFEEEEEERRLFFVGMTRAKDELELSYYTNPDTIRTFPGPSRFVRMIPPGLLQMDGDLPEKQQEEVNLKELKRLVQEERKAAVSEAAERERSRAADGPEPESEKQHLPELKKATHPKYGTGVILREDELMVTVLFEGYGEKEFLKAFCELQ
ncbi:MAG: ATP-dependent helicase [Lachnospiraceae bacterium]|nr:ATP-dependent helicase [Lachnospiraceae bacterium]